VGPEGGTVSLEGGIVIIGINAEHRWRAPLQQGTLRHAADAGRERRRHRQIGPDATFTGVLAVRDPDSFPRNGPM